MIDRVFAPLLTFVMLIASTAAFAAILFASPRPEVVVAQGMPPAPVMLETVIIEARRAPPAPQVASDEQHAPASHTTEGRGVLLRRSAD